MHSRRWRGPAMSAADVGGSEGDGDGGGSEWDMGQLRQRMRDVWAREQEEASWDEDDDGDDPEPEELITAFDGNRVVGVPKRVWVLLFEGKEKGIYSIRLERPDSRGMEEVVLAFTAEDDAARYKAILSMQNFPSASVAVSSDPPRQILIANARCVQTISMSTLQQLCSDNGYRLGLVPEVRASWATDSPPDNQTCFIVGLHHNTT